jgi:signal transduction histidine kinase
MVVLVWILLFTFGLSGILTGIFNGSQYFKKDYFKTRQFERQLNQFIDFLSTFELIDMTKEEAKEKIEVTEEEINEHRYRYGNLPDQIANIKNQYESKIQQALLGNNKEIADMYIAERDCKIEDITNNFKSDEHVRAKIVKEKEEKIDDYYQRIEEERTDFIKWKAAFVYYLKDITTGEVYTNWKGTEKQINPKNMLFVRSYPATGYGYISTERRYIPIYSDDLEPLSRTKNARRFEGKIAVPKSASVTNLVLSEHRNYQQKQKVFFIYIISCMIAFMLSIYVYKKKSISQCIAWEKGQSYYRRIPIDIRVISFILIGLFTLLLMWNGDLYLYESRHEYLFDFIQQMLIHLVVTAFFVAITFIQGKFLLDALKNKPDLKAEWKKSLLYRFYQGIREAFLNRSIGAQVLILLSVVFVLGAGAMLVVIEPEPELILFYALAFLIIGIPMFLLIIKRAGYFNRIVHSTGEIVQGNLESDLPITGKSAFATLAGNINLLKRGVKKSLKEQAKSERLKTELITNVSHDLRTPLTSIITYTELLKTPNLAEEDRDAYIQIIDRKSKRLKVLIDDLFEASKMASGSVELVKEKVDIVQLLQQAFAEYNEEIKESKLQFRVTNPNKPVYTFADGQKMWRVFDNLIGNILKYSLENTRVYISVEAFDDKAVIAFKNIAKYELGGDINELFERFKRGDTSRHTEGSGLGLAIAKSIVDLHEGNLDIKIDGDLFKVTVSLNTI